MTDEHTTVGRAITLSGLANRSSKDWHEAYDELVDSNHKNFDKSWKKFVKVCERINKNFEDFYKKGFVKNV